MPKARSTCTRCSMRRQKCDRQNPCGRCVANKEAHLCTTEWANGYDPKIHRQYPSKAASSSPSSGMSIPRSTGQDVQQWSTTPFSGHHSSVPFRSPESGSDHQRFSTTPQFESDPLEVQEGTPSSSNLDFVTQGRADMTNDISVGGILFSKDEGPTEQNPGQIQGPPLDNEVNDSGLSQGAHSVEIFHLQSILPAKSQVLQMVEYHQQFMLFWNGGIYHGPSFTRMLHGAYNQSHELILEELDMRWVALLFSILAASVLASPEQLSASWGFNGYDKKRLAKRWGNATFTCLQLGDYASKYHPYSIQAILNLHSSEHLVGSVRRWGLYKSAALTMAKGLGMHKLGPHPDDGKTGPLSPEQKEALIKREIGRRIWFNIASLDWLSSTAQGPYTIQRKHFTTIKPGYFDEESMTPVPDGTPTFAHVGNYLNDIAYDLVCYHDEEQAATDLATKFDIVLKYDAKLRAATSDKMPVFLMASTPPDPNWPPWVHWARHVHQASWAHKIIIMHQSFLNRSFKQPQYAYSRWACCNAAKTIIKELCHERGPQEPQWWVGQAMIVTASICLATDIFHRPEQDTEAQDYLRSIETAVHALNGWPLSSIATYGSRLLNSILQEYYKKFGILTTPNDSSSVTLSGTLPENMAPLGMSYATCDSMQPVLMPPAHIPMDPWPARMFDVDMIGFEDIMDTFPLDSGMDNNMFYESMMIANQQYQQFR